MIAGSEGMAGAAVFAAKAAYRMGCGLVRVATVESNRAILQQLVPEAVLAVYNDTTDVVKICGNTACLGRCRGSQVPESDSLHCQKKW